MRQVEKEYHSHTHAHARTHTRISCHAYCINNSHPFSDPGPHNSHSQSKPMPPLKLIHLPN